MRPISITLFFIFGILSLLSARNITGTVKDEAGWALAGANVEIVGTDKGITTDFDGFFELSVPDGEVSLHIYYIGYEVQTVKLKADQVHVDVVLSESAALMEVVLTSEKRDRKKRKSSTDKLISVTPGVVSEYVGYTEESVVYDAVGYTAGTGSEAAPEAGQLTAGILNDYGKWDLWQDIQENELKEWQDSWGIRPWSRYPVQLQTPNGYPVVDAEVELLEGDMVIWAARTDNTGQAELWANLYEDKEAGNDYKIRVEYQGQTFGIAEAKEFHEGGTTKTINVVCDIPQVVDIAFVVDATGSMGDEIEYLKSELLDVIGRSQQALEGVDLRIGSVFYRDSGDNYVTRKSHFSTKVEKTLKFIQAQGAAGGGDNPEAIEEALDEALDELIWSEKASARLLFLVLDAPPHQTDEIKARLERQIRRASEMGIRIIPIACSGTDRSTEYLMRSFALATNGSYIYLTDDSGIGGAHIKPVTDETNSNMLNDLLVETITYFCTATQCDEQPQYADVPLKDTMQVAWKPQPTDSADVKVDVQPDFSWSYYPNPCKGQLWVEIEGELDYLYLVNSAGKLLRRIPITNFRFSLDLSAYPSGMYFLKGVGKDGQEVSGQVVLVRYS